MGSFDCAKTPRMRDSHWIRNCSCFEYLNRLAPNIIHMKGSGEKQPISHKEQTEISLIKG